VHAAQVVQVEVGGDFAADITVCQDHWQRHEHSGALARSSA
jgi:hypothetical protein